MGSSLLSGRSSYNVDAGRRSFDADEAMTSTKDVRGWAKAGPVKLRQCTGRFTGGTGRITLGPSSDRFETPVASGPKRMSALSTRDEENAKDVTLRSRWKAGARTVFPMMDLPWYQHMPGKMTTTNETNDGCQGACSGRTGFSASFNAKTEKGVKLSRHEAGR